MKRRLTWMVLKSKHFLKVFRKTLLMKQNPSRQTSVDLLTGGQVHGGQRKKEAGDSQSPPDLLWAPFHLWLVAPQALSSPWGAHSPSNGAEGRWERPSRAPGSARPLGCRQGGHAGTYRDWCGRAGDGHCRCAPGGWRAQAAMHR